MTSVHVPLFHSSGGFYGVRLRIDCGAQQHPFDNCDLVTFWRCTLPTTGRARGSFQRLPKRSPVRCILCIQYAASEDSASSVADTHERSKCQWRAVRSPIMQQPLECRSPHMVVRLSSFVELHNVDHDSLSLCCFGVSAVPFDGWLLREKAVEMCHDHATITASILVAPNAHR